MFVNILIILICIIVLIIHWKYMSYLRKHTVSLEDRFKQDLRKLLDENKG